VNLKTTDLTLLLAVAALFAAGMGFLAVMFSALFAAFSVVELLLAESLTVDINLAFLVASVLSESADVGAFVPRFTSAGLVVAACLASHVTLVGSQTGAVVVG
jgi:hypothetical protein